jgi:carboxypeptidase family protein
MRLRSLLLVTLALLLLPASAMAQVSTSTVNGTITDESKSVLPGVTVTATNVQTGRQYVAVSDDRGVYRLVNMPPGTYRMQAELAGFATVEIPNVELLVGAERDHGVRDDDRDDRRDAHGDERSSAR